MIRHSLHSVVERQAGLTPDDVAIITPGLPSLTFARLWVQMQSTLRELRNLGIGPTDCTAICLPEGPELAVAVLSVSSAAICAPLNPDFTEAEAKSYLLEVKARGLIVAKGQASALRDAARACDLAVFELVCDRDAAGCFYLEADRAVVPATGGFHSADEAALALYTSGTAAHPRLVLLSQRNITFAADHIRQTLQLTAADRSLTVMPLFHIHGLSTLFASLLAGASVICPKGPVLDQIPELFAEFQPTWYSAAPAIHQLILDYARKDAQFSSSAKLRLMRSASAPMPAAWIEEMEATFGAPFVEAYGLTEGAPLVASNRLAPFVRKRGSVGQAAGSEVAILDDAGQPVPAGTEGEIAIRGLNVGRYAATPARPPEEWLRTGDLGYLDADGYLFVTGRRKEVINRGGEKISPREVEEVLLQHPLVQQAAVFAVPHAVLGENVGAAIVCNHRAGADTQATIEQIRQFAANRLAAFKTPQQIVLVEQLPQGPMAKLKRQQLAKQLLTPAIRTATPLQTSTELRLAAIWMEVLECACPARHDNFFELGGHSLAATRVIGRLRRELGVTLSPERFFDRPTVASMAQYIDTLRQNAMSGDQWPGTFPLSFGQRRLWFLDQLNPGASAYNMSTAMRFGGKLDEAALRTALEEVCRRHQPLCASIRLVDGEPVHVLLDAPQVEWTITEVAPDAVQQAMQEDAERPFVLEHGPLLRASLLRLGEQEHVLLLTMHHIVSDGWSVGVLWRELAEHYAAQREQRPVRIGALPIGFADYVARQQEEITGFALDPHLAWWREQLAGAPPVSEFPPDRPRPAFQTQRGARYRSMLGPEVLQPLKAFSMSAQTSLYVVMLAAFEMLLARCAGQQDVVVGTPVANRTARDTEGLIGFFANTVPVRARIESHHRFLDLLEQLKAAVSAALVHQDVPFERLVDQLRIERDPSRTPLFQIMFAFQNLPEALPVFPGLKAEAVEPGVGGAKFDLTLYLTESAQGMRAVWLYNEDLFDASTIQRLDVQYRNLLAAVIADPRQPIAELPMQHAESHPTAPPPTPQSFSTLFEQQVLFSPTHPAVEASNGALTYAELNAWANCVAAVVAGTGAEMVGLFLPRTSVMVAGAIGVWKAHRAYVPLDPCYPAERLTSMLSDSGITTVLTCHGLLPKLAAIAPHIKALCVDLDAAELAQMSDGNPGIAASLDSPAYMIYTSGSTGRPKGVVVTHANLGACALALPAELGVVAGDRYLHTASLSFSSSVRQMVVPLSVGATVVVASEAQRRNQEALFECIAERQVTIADLVPTYWASCVRMLQSLEPDRRETLLDNQLRLVLSASEPLPKQLVLDWMALGHTASIINMYGQTETTGIVTTHRVEKADLDNAGWVPVGRPIAGTEVRVMDPTGGQVPVGSWGELQVGGANVCKGYFLQPNWTAERFVGNFYRTGDRARMRPNGVVELSGRLDQQVKIRGYRVEPAEVEVTIHKHPDVREAAVVALGDVGSPLLAAALVARSGVNEARLREDCRLFLKDRLPAYMVPTTFMVMDSLPRTPNGKLDRAALCLKLNGHADSSASIEHPAQTATEQNLAAVWRKVLQLDHVGLDDNFFDLGGDSIRSVDIVAQGKQAGLHFTLKHLFQNQTVRALARVLDEGDRQTEPEGGHVRVSIDSLRSFGRTALEQAGLAPEGAAIVTEVQLESSLRGQPTHNMADIPRYAKRIANGVIQPQPSIRIVRETAVSALIDGDNGPGQWVATVVMETAIRKARQSGIAIVGAKHSNHFGAAGHYAWQAAEAGLIGFCTTNGPLILAPTGGIQPTFGNNPIAVGLPAAQRLPVVLDIAMNTAPRGRIGLHVAEGRPLEPGWIMDKEGRPSQDLADLAAGLGMPIGGHKGYGLALAMEALAGVLTGAGFCWDHEGHRSSPKPGGLDLGHLFIVIDPEIFMPVAQFRERVDRLIDQTKSGTRASGVNEILLPGERELQARASSLHEGVLLRRSAYDQLCRYAALVGIEPPEAL